MDHLLHVALTTLGLYVGLMYVGAPILIRFSQKMSARPQFEPFQPEYLPPEAAQYLSECARILQADGFEPVASLSMPHQVASVIPIFTMFVNRATKDKAMATLFYTTINGVTQLKTRYVEFTTRFTDDTEINTTNNASPGAFQPSRKKKTFRLTQLQNLHQLYACHRELVRKHGSGAEKVLPPVGGDADWLGYVMRESYDEQVRYGRLYLDRGGDAYRPTWKGAYLMTWGLLWPVAAIRRTLGRRQSVVLLRSLAPALDGAGDFV